MPPPLDPRNLGDPHAPQPAAAEATATGPAADAHLGSSAPPPEETATPVAVDTGLDPWSLGAPPPPGGPAETPEAEDDASALADGPSGLDPWSLGAPPPPGGPWTRSGEAAQLDPWSLGDPAPEPLPEAEAEDTQPQVPRYRPPAEPTDKSAAQPTYAPPAQPAQPAQPAPGGGAIQVARRPLPPGPQPASRPPQAAPTIAQRYPKMLALLQDPPPPAPPRAPVAGRFFPRAPAPAGPDLNELMATLADSLLIGETPEGDTELRLTLKDAVFSGTELRLRSVDGALHASLLPPDLSSYLSLNAELDSLADRLRARGLNVAELHLRRPLASSQRGAPDAPS